MHAAHVKILDLTYLIEVQRSIMALKGVIISEAILGLTES